MTAAATLALRVAGALVALAGAVLTAAVEAFYTPLYAGGVRLPVTVVLAVLTNVVLVWFAYAATGSEFFALVPGLVWMGLMVLAADRTSEGDIVLHDLLGLVTIFAGVAAYAFAAYSIVVHRLIIPGRLRPVPGPPAAARRGPSPPPPGSAGGPARPAPDRDPPGWHTPS